MGMTWYHMVAAWLLAWVALVIVSQRSWAVSWLALGLMAAHIGDWAMKAAMNAMPRKNIDGNGKAVLITGEFRAGASICYPVHYPLSSSAWAGGTAARGGEAYGNGIGGIGRCASETVSHY